MNKNTPVDRLSYSGELAPVMDRVCAAYKIGHPIDFSVIETGYEDCNVILKTANNKFVAKIFSKERSREDIIRITTILEKVGETDVNHPSLMKTENDEIFYTDSQAKGIYLVLMKFIEGKNFIELGRIPNPDELEMVIEQAVKINCIDYHPQYLFDSWAIPNIKVMFEKVRKYIRSDILGLVEQVIAQYFEIPVDSLPHCFVHGDFTKTNVLKGDDGGIHILDFSVANWYPRIQEISIIVANLLYDKDNPSTLQERIDLVWSKYDKLKPLTEKERKHIYPYALAGTAMEFLGAHQEKYIYGNDTKETDFWMNLGQSGLLKEFAAND
ncbi:phosphotransferase [Candidatus Dojkabacteria bacterium]|nr:phosphotransferase [Candidatus Dojkabacteria bacterium]